MYFKYEIILKTNFDDPIPDDLRIRRNEDSDQAMRIWMERVTQAISHGGARISVMSIDLIEDNYKKFPIIKNGEYTPEAVEYRNKVEKEKEKALR